ncbi:MAG: divergent polysaccharide deacetylase family protein [Firmicutes bacterium]|nr:divergent polysaccharide deacetylase family protein [Bacillota bacterium]
MKKKSSSRRGAGIFPYILVIILGITVFTVGFCTAVGENGNLGDRLKTLFTQTFSDVKNDHKAAKKQQKEKVKQGLIARNQTESRAEEAAKPDEMRPQKGNEAKVETAPENAELPAPDKENKVEAPAPAAVKPETTVKEDKGKISAGKDARKPEAPKGFGIVAIIIDDFGNSLNNVDNFCSLEIPVTFAVLPQLKNSKKITAMALDNGKAVILHLPLENQSGINPGPGTITTNMSRDVITKDFKLDLSFVPGAEGFNNHEGSKATENAEVMDEIMKQAADRGLYFIDSATSSKSVGMDTAARFGVPAARRNIFLDNEDNVDYICGQLDKLTEKALKDGSAIGIGHVRANTYAALAKMIPDMKNKGIEFVFVRELVK